MRSFVPFTAILALTAAVPVAVPLAEPALDLHEFAAIERRQPVSSIEARQTVGTTANEFKAGGCRDIIWFFARGSTEVGNMVRAFVLAIVMSTFYSAQHSSGVLY